MTPTTDTRRPARGRPRRLVRRSLRRARRLALRTPPGRAARTGLRRVEALAVERARELALRHGRSVLLRYVRARPRPSDRAGAERRVTILLSSAWGMGGTIRATLNLAEHLATDHEVEIITIYRSRDEPFLGPFPPGVRVTPLEDRRSGRLNRTWAERRLRQWPSVLIHPADRLADYFSFWTDLRLARLLRRRTGVLLGTRPAFNLLVAELDLPGVISIGQEQMHLLHHNGRLRAAMRDHYPRLDAMVVLTELDRGRYDGLLGGRVPLYRIPNPAFQMRGPKADMRVKTILAAGRLRRQKGYDVLIPAFAQVAPHRPDWRLRICGTGRERPVLRELIDRHGLGDQVSLEGPLADMATGMEQASIFAMSSRFEGFPLTLLEAMSKGMAVISFDCPTGPADIVDDHVNGLLIPHLDVDAFARGLLELTGDEELRRRCATAAVETARQYRMAEIGPRWEALFRELQGAGGDGPERVLTPPSSDVATMAGRS